MVRMLSTIAMLAALAAAGFTVYTHVQHEGFSRMFHRLGFGQTGADDALLAAGAQLQSYWDAHRSYRGVALSRSDVILVYTTDLAYCVQTTKADKTSHLAGPEGSPAPGPC